MFAITEFSRQAVARTTQTMSAQDRSDEALVRAIAGGDKRAVQVLYDRHHLRVYRFILRFTNDASLAEDIVSEVFIGAWRRAGGFKSKSQVSTWLLAIARNKAISALNRHRDEQLDDAMASSIADPTDGAEAIIEDHDRSAVIRKWPRPHTVAVAGRATTHDERAHPLPGPGRQATRRASFGYVAPPLPPSSGENVTCCDHS